MVPEVRLNIGYDVRPWLRLSVGYEFLYWSSVSRPGDQDDQAVNVNFVPTSNTFGTAGGANRPAFGFHSTDFFAHGANFGLEFRY